MKEERSMMQTHIQDTQPLITWSDLAPVKAQWQELYEQSEGNSLRIIAHTALRAISHEEDARARYLRTSISHTPDFVDAYRLCEALNLMKEALESWIYVAARLWYFLERGQETEQDTSKEALTRLHAYSIAEQQRLFSTYMQMQQEVQAFFNEHHILVAMNIIDQALDLS